MVIELKILLILICLFNVIDYFGTSYLLKLGAEELNPLINITINTPLFPVFKLIIIPIFILILWKYQALVIKSRIYVFAIYLCFSAYTMLMIYYSYLYFNI